MGTQIEQFEILLEHDIDEQYQYEPGEMLCGTVQLQVSDPIKITAIQVRCLAVIYTNSDIKLD